LKNEVNNRDEISFFIFNWLHTTSVDAFEEGVQKSYGQRQIAGNFFENFHLESRRFDFEYKNPWGLLLGGEKKGFDFGGLGALNGGRFSKDSKPSAALAAAIFKKSRSTEEMRNVWNKVGTSFHLISFAENL
jgi:hypothetical protein